MFANLTGSTMAALRAGEGCAGVVDGIAAVGGSAQTTAAAAAVNVTVLIGQALSTAAAAPLLLNFAGLPPAVHVRVETTWVAASGRAASPEPVATVDGQKTTEADGTLSISLGVVAPSDVHRVRLVSVVLPPETLQ